MAIGDSHGNSRFVHAAIERAARLRDKVDRDVFIVSVGDFGFWPGVRGEAFVGGVDELARRHGLAFWAIDGNHDYPGDGRSSRAGYRAWSDPAPSPDQPGFVHVPRGTVVRIPIGTGCWCHHRPLWRRRVTRPRATPTRDELVARRDDHRPRSRPDRRLGRKVDLMIAHDTPWRPPDFATSLNVSPKVRSLMAENQLRLAEIVAAWQPRLLLHGHFHHSYRATAPGRRRHLDPGDLHRRREHRHINRNHRPRRLRQQGEPTRTRCRHRCVRYLTANVRYRNSVKYRVGMALRSVRIAHL